jgi:hypothetical protein
MLVLGIPRTVAYELARPLVEGTVFNSHPIPKGYAIVLVDGVKPRHRRSKLEYSGENGEWKLGKNIGCHILWRKRDIEFGEEDFETSSSGSSLPSSNLFRRHHQSINLCCRHHNNNDLCRCHHNSRQLHHRHHQRQLRRRNNQRLLHRHHHHHKRRQHHKTIHLHHSLIELRWCNKSQFHHRLRGFELLYRMGRLMRNWKL